MGLELLLFVISPVVNAGWDALHGETEHLKSWSIRALSIIALSVAMSFTFANPWPNIVTSIWGLYIMIGASIEFALFDYLYNWFKGHSWKYIGEEKYHKDDFTYKFYKKAGPYIILFIKLFVLITCVSLYYQLDAL